MIETQGTCNFIKVPKAPNLYFAIIYFKKSDVLLSCLYVSSILCDVASDLSKKYLSLLSRKTKKKHLTYPEDSNITAKVSDSFVKIPSRSFLLIPEALKYFNGRHMHLDPTSCFSHLWIINHLTFNFLTKPTITKNHWNVHWDRSASCGIEKPQWDSQQNYLWCIARSLKSIRLLEPW